MSSRLQDIKSPCQSICILTDGDDGDYCIGCFRTADEILEWYNFTDEERETITAALPTREDELG